jgi:tetratricopeptide (TPR) repeat protein
MPLFAIAIITIPLYLSYKKSKDNFRIVLFCLLYFFGTIVFILQFLSDGKTIISDRYSYVSYFGIFFLVIYFAHRYWQKSKALHIPILILLGGVSCVLAYISYGRTRIWHNAGTMWKDVIVKTGYDFPIPYMSLGDWYKEKQEYDSAFPYYQALAALHSKSPEVYQDLGKIYGMHQQFDSCLANISRSLRLDSTNYGAYLDRAITYCMMSKFDFALKDFNKAFTLDSTDPGLWTQRAAALFQTGQFALASKDYSRLIRKQPESPENWYQRGNCELNLGIFAPAIKDYQQALSIKANYPDCLYNLSVAYDKIADYKNALDYALKAKQAGAKVPDEYLNRIQKAAK